MSVNYDYSIRTVNLTSGREFSAKKTGLLKNKNKNHIADIVEIGDIRV